MQKYRKEITIPVVEEIIIITIIITITTTEGLEARPPVLDLSEIIFPSSNLFVILCNVTPKSSIPSLNCQNKGTGPRKRGNIEG